MKSKVKITYSLLIIMFFSSFTVFSNGIEKDRHEKKRTIKKEFSVSKDNTLYITNKYGDITLTTWNKNTIDIEVTITVEGTNTEAVERKFKTIDVEFRQEDDEVYAKTLINSKRFSIGWFGKTNSSCNIDIDYTVKMPVSNHVNLNNDYGFIFIDKLKGSAKITSDYGGIRIGELHNLHNKIYMDYGTSSSIEYIHSGKVYTDYSHLSIEKANSLILNADYSNIHIDNVENIDFNNDYGSLKLGDIKTLTGNGDYLSFTIMDKLHNSLKLNCDYGSVKIHELAKDFKDVSIRSDYTGIKIGMDATVSFNFHTKVSYADVKFKDLEVNFTSKTEKMFSKEYKGYINNANPKSTLSIESSYGGVKFYLH